MKCSALVVLMMLVTVVALAAEKPAADGPPVACVFDTGAKSGTPLSPEALAARTGWVSLAEGDLVHQFKGDAVLVNGPLTVVFRGDVLGPEVYCETAGGLKRRATIYECGAGIRATLGLVGIALMENGPAAVAIETETGRSGQRGPRVLYRLTVGQPWVEVRSREQGTVICLACEARYVLVPDFFGDDMAFGAGMTEETRRALPAENCFLGLVDRGSAMVMGIWQSGVRQVAAEGFRNDSGGIIGMYPLKDKAVWFAFLEGENLWHERPVKPADEGRTVALQWKPPFPAKWRADLLRPDHTTGSWFFSDARETAQAVAGPCRLDGDRATVAVPPAAEPPQGAETHPGPIVVYPLDRTQTTPLTIFTPVDIMRNTLGVGPCQYVLETEGLTSQDNPTPDLVMAWIEKSLKRKKSPDADEVKERLKAMAELAARVDARIKRYAQFAAEAKAMLASNDPDVLIVAETLAPTVGAMERAAAAGLGPSPASERAARLAEPIVAAAGKGQITPEFERLAAEVRAIGVAQERALSSCRMTARWLKEQCAVVAERGLRPAETARNLGERIETVLRSGAGRGNAPAP